MSWILGTAARRVRSIRPRHRSDVSRPDEFLRLKLTRLEDRRVLDAAGLVADIQPGSTGSNPQHFTEFAGSLYFSASGNDAQGNAVGQEVFRLGADGQV